MTDDAAIARLRVAPVLHGVRGEPPMDLDALADAAIAVGQLMLDHPAVISLDDGLLNARSRIPNRR